MKILVIGGGGREHAIVSALKNADVYCIMAKKNPGIIKSVKKYLIHTETDADAVVAFAKECGVEFA